jgi:hypothetical protein
MQDNAPLTHSASTTLLYTALDNNNSNNDDSNKSGWLPRSCTSGQVLRNILSKYPHLLMPGRVDRPLRSKVQPGLCAAGPAALQGGAELFKPWIQPTEIGCNGSRRCRMRESAVKGSYNLQTLPSN